MPHYFEHVFSCFVNRNICSLSCKKFVSVSEERIGKPQHPLQTESILKMIKCDAYQFANQCDRIANMWWCVIAFALFIIGSVQSSNFGDAKDYLVRYGYMQDVGDSSTREITMHNALLLFQETYKLYPIDGALNEVTLEFMNRKRCGVSDSPMGYQLHAHKWKKKELGWYFQRATPAANFLAEKAFAEWEKEINLRFVRDARNPDILISFKFLNHTFEKNRDNMCNSPLDGPGIILGHALLPDGLEDTLEIHLDGAEDWDFTENVPSIDSSKVSLLGVLIHEIGHTLGLKHSDDSKSIMFSVYNPSGFRERGEISLTIDDVLGIQNLYGEKIEEKPQTTTLSTPTEKILPVVPVDTKGQKLDLCSLSSVDGMLIVGRRMYIFYKKWVWPKNIDSKNYDAPQLITNWLRFLPSNFSRIETIYQRPSGYVVLVAGGIMYQFSVPNLELEEQWPKRLGQLWIDDKSSRKINGVVNSYTGRTYIFYNDNYYGVIDECYLKPVTFGLISDDFLGVPSKFTSVFRYKNGMLYFFHKKNYYEYDEFANKIVRAGKFDLSLFDIECAKDNILEQLKNLLLRLSNVVTSADDEDVD